MADLVERAANATRESRQIEFKSTFDPRSSGDWCEIIKDIVAIANSGGGIIVFGLNNNGTFSETSVAAIGEIDHADLANKINTYTDWVDPLVEIRDLERKGRILPAFVIEAVFSPLAFGRPGTYESSPGKQKTAFGVGTVYFRHGAKSEPGTSGDIRSAFDRQLNSTRRSWLKQVRKVSRAPLGSQVIIDSASSQTGMTQSAAVRFVNDPAATPVYLTRGDGTAGGTFVHEEVSEGLFDEINNVVEANRVLARSQSRFFLGPQLYYRVYAERLDVKQGGSEIGKLLHAGACEFYAPNLFWACQMDGGSIAKNVGTLYLAPRSPQIHWLMRMAILLGADFCSWLLAKWDRKWGHYSQPPNFYFSFGEMIKNSKGVDQRVLAARLSPTSKISVPGETEVSISELLRDSARAEALLSIACMAVFHGSSQLRAAARCLDYLAYGSEVIKRGTEISRSVFEAIGERPPGDYKEPAKVG
ncbi:MAG: ATP-binding protein [Acidobacteriaceae bacterium]